MLFAREDCLLSFEGHKELQSYNQGYRSHNFLMVNTGWTGAGETF